MSEPKTRPTDEPVEDFLARIEDPVKQADSRTLVGLMSAAAGEPAVMWGTAIVGFGSRPIRYANGSQMDWPTIAFSPRKETLTLYLPEGGAIFPDLLAKLGPHKSSKGCLYIKHLAKVDLQVLEELIRSSVAAE